MRELDVLLERYLERDYANASASQKVAFESLLSLQDPEILELLTGRAVPEDHHLRDVVQRLLTRS